VWRRHLQTVIGLAVAGLITTAWADDFTPEEQRGKRLYIEGVAADGTSVMATLGQGSLRVPGTKVPCVSCHGSDGLGRPDAGVVPSNITWANLTKPYGLRHDNGRSHPPYTADAILRAVTAGVDPAGNALHLAMPRYALDGTAQHDLVAYLKRLGSDSDQDIGGNEIVVAAVVPAGGPLAGIGSVVERLLSAYFDRINQEGGIYNRRIVLKTAAFDSSGSAVDALRRLMSQTKVFAVVAPLALGEDVALVEFTEGRGLPVVGPLAHYRRSAVKPQGFTFYLTAGPAEQARVLVKYAQNNLAPADPKIAILSSDDGAGLGIGDAILQQGRGAEWAPTLSLHLAGGVTTADIVSQLRIAAVNIIFYDGGASHLAELVKEASSPGWKPAILTSGLAVTRESFEQMREARARVFVAYPLLGSDQSPDGVERLHSLQVAYGISARHLPMQVTALASARILIEGLQRVGRDLTRAKFVAALAALQNFDTGLAPPISFGPNRRTGVRGAHVVAFGRGQNEPEHVWISLD
jgi:ABC-type branched-subunit amino acid transport system substrate-binding protein